jgi:lyso-ornithine lipid O-acyltransferase
MIRQSVRVSMAAAVTAALAAGLVTEERLREVSPDRRERYVRAWAHGMLRALGVEVRVEGAFQRSEKPHLVVSNHRSTIDIFLMLHLFGGHLLARGDMEQWPAVGWMAIKAGTVFVDRSDAGSGGAAIRKLTELLKRGRTIGVFAEGTTFDDDEVRPFHPGAFMAITRVRGTITPVGFAYASRDAHYTDEPIGEHFKRILAAKRTVVGVAIGAPFAAEGSIANVRDRCHAEVQRLVHRARALTTPP